MTISELIAHVDSVKPNQYTRDAKARWAEELDRRVYLEVIDVHENPEQLRPPDSYGDDTELVIKAPYEGVYAYYLMAMIDLHNAEILRHNNMMGQFSALYTDYRVWYKRTHMPLPLQTRLL